MMARSGNVGEAHIAVMGLEFRLYDFFGDASVAFVNNYGGCYCRISVICISLRRNRLIRADAVC